MGKSFLQEIDDKQKVIIAALLFFITIIGAMYVYSGTYTFIMSQQDLEFIQHYIFPTSWAHLLGLLAVFFLWLLIVVVKFKQQFGG